MTHAAEIVEILLRQGVDTFCIAPGSRSSPLAIAIAKRVEAETIVHFDERGLGFLALGLAKAKEKPIAILVTSGTAIGNLMPAVMEAAYSHIPLILLTADRPPELRRTGANQTCDQVKFFGNNVRWEFDLPPDATGRFLSSTVSQAVYHANRSPRGPVQLNCMFREPFFQDEQIPVQSSTQYAFPNHHLDEKVLDHWASKIDKIEKGVIIAGALSHSQPTDALVKLSEKLQWPILSDILSNTRLHSIPYYEFFRKEFHFDAILHFGDLLVSKHLLEQLSKTALQWYCHVVDHPNRYDPLHLVSHRLECDPSYFVDQLLQRVRTQTSSWLKNWQEMATIVKEQVVDFFEEHSNLNEPYIFHALSKNLEENSNLFIANSMPIRDADKLFFPKKNVKIFANRGLSGIDGNIATAVGIAKGLDEPLIAVIGDQTLLHDLNSLPLLKKSDVPILLCVINNGGGGIFSFLPVSQQDHFETHVANAHIYHFEAAAKLFDLHYLYPQDRLSFDRLLERFIKNPQTSLVEITTDRKENFQLHQEMQKINENVTLSPRFSWFS